MPRAPPTVPPNTRVTVTDPLTLRHDRARAIDLIGLGLLALLVRIPAFLSSKALTFDDGVFSLSALAMRDGGIPFADVFSSQGPLFLPLVWLGDLLGLRSINSPRILGLLAGVGAVVLTYLVALRLRDRTAALLAGALVATSGALAWVTGPLAADGPAIAFAVAAVLFSLWLRDDPNVRNAVLVGLATGAVLSTKSLEAPVLVIVGLVLLAPIASAARRRELDRAAIGRLATAVGSSVVLFLAVSLPFGMADVWDQSVRYRTEAAANRDIPATAGKLITTLWDRDLALLFFAVLALVCGVLAQRGRAGRTGADSAEQPSPRWWSHSTWSDTGQDWEPSNALLAVSWLACTLIWLVLVVSPLWRPHVAAVTVPLALVVAVYRPPARVCAVGAVLALPLVFIQLDGLLVPSGYDGVRAELVSELEDLPPGAWVISDEPGVVWRAGRRTTDDLVDPSMLRREQGRYTAESLLQAAQDPRVCAFVAISDQRFGAFDELPAGLAAIGYDPVDTSGDGSVLFVRSDCEGSPGGS